MKAYWNCTKEQLEEMFGFREKGLTESTMIPTTVTIRFFMYVKDLGRIFSFRR